MKFQYLSLKSFLTSVTKISPMLQKMKKNKSFLTIMLHFFFSPKGAKWYSSQSWFVKVLCWAIDIQIEGEEPPLWQCSHHFFTATDIKSFSIFFFEEKELVCCTDIVQLAQAWSATVSSQRFEMVHWQQQAIAEMCSASQWQLVCFCNPCSLNYTEKKKWNG